MTTANRDVQIPNVGALSIGALGKAAGVAVETIRYYERIGLFSAPERTAAGYRQYGLEHARRLSFIRASRGLGLRIEAIRALLRLADDPDRPCDDVDNLVQAHLQEVERRIAELTSLRDELLDLTHCRGHTISDCRIIDALSPERPSRRDDSPHRL